MKPCFNPTCDRHGHLLTGFGESPQTMALFVLPTAEEITLSLEGGGESKVSNETRFNRLSRRASRKIGDVPVKTVMAEKVESKLRPTKKIESKPLSIRRVIVAVNLTRKCDATVRYAAEISRGYNAALYICYVFWPSLRIQGNRCDLIDREQREFRHKLEELAEQVRGSVPICKAALLAGNPAERISTLAHDIHADLIVIASFRSDPHSTAQCGQGGETALSRGGLPRQKRITFDQTRCFASIDSVCRMRVRTAGRSRPGKSA
jgi:nucleotide-binding universal stress UspA family protein